MSESGDPFEAVKAQAAQPGRTAPSHDRNVGAQVAPVPAEVPPRLDFHKVYGSPSDVWAYRDEAGAVLGYVCRFLDKDGGKAVLPQTLRRSDRGGLAWKWKGFDDPRPLYGLDRLASRPLATVLVVEGEKVADAAARRFPDFVSISWPGGSNAVSKADWRALIGRSVVIWPDADPPGLKAAEKVAQEAKAVGAASVAVVRLPAFLPPGWDLADSWQEGFGPAQAQAAIEGAIADAQPAGVEWPVGFRMTPDGLWYAQAAQGGGVAETRISAAFEVLGEARDPSGSGWAVVVAFSDRDGRRKVIPVSRARLAAGSADVRSELADAGLVISPMRGKADKFAVALSEVKCDRRYLLMSSTGWFGDRFVLPGEVIGPAGGEPVLFTGEGPSLNYRRSGSLVGWRERIAAMAPGNPNLLFAISLAFLGPLLRLLGLEGGGVHFTGHSSKGKSTLGSAAGSVWGGGGSLDFAQSWRSTANALEMLAWGHNETLLVLDEIQLIQSEEVGAAVYTLASGQSKARSKADGSLRRRSEWRVAVLSSGEFTIADHIRNSRRGDRPMTGQELRILNLPADAGAGMGIFCDLHGHENSNALALLIKDASKQHYGHAGPAFLEALAGDRNKQLELARDLLARFANDVHREGDTGQVQRAAMKFGAIAVAGELATLFGVTGWAPGTAAQAAQTLYHQWAASFGRSRSREASEILRRLRGAIESERSKFAAADEEIIEEGTSPASTTREGEARSLLTYGWRRVDGREVTYMFTGEGWAQLFRGHNPSEAARIVDQAGFLIRPAAVDRLQKRVSIRGEKFWLYCVRGTITEAELGD